jgi:hypothetical protein
MSKERELLKGAVEWMHELKYAWVEERDWGDRDLLYLVADIKRIEELLAQPEHTEQEPVAWKVIDGTHGGYMFSRIKPTEHTYKYNEVIPLYTSPPRRKPLSDEEVYSIGNKYAFHAAVREIERIHGIGGGE